MSAFDADAEQLQRSLDSLSSLVSERDALRSKGQPTGDLVARLRTALTAADKLSARVSAAATKSDGSAPLSQTEVQRRRDIVRRAAADLARVRALEKAVVSATDRDALLGGAGGGGGGEAAPRLTGDQLMLKAKEETRAQDDILESMSKGLEGLKVMGRAIGDESDLQMKLLDNLENEVDKGNASLKRETARAEYVTRDANTCWLYITICLLLGLLVGLVDFPCGGGAARAARSP